MNSPFKKHFFAAAICSLVTGGAYAAPFTVNVGYSSVTIPIPNVKAGDTINIEAILSSGDLNENGENEPLVIRSSSGFSATIGNYAQARAFSFKAASNGETLTTYISGADGDESAKITIDVNQKTRLTQAEKDALNKAGADLNIQAGWYAAAAVACGVAPEPTVTKACLSGFGALSAATWVAAGKLTTLALDPIDPNYTIIATPVNAAVQLVTVQPGITQPVAASFNALLLNRAQVIGLADAIITSINKAQGANAAGATAWETKQMQAASQYAVQMSSLLEGEPSLAVIINQALVSAGAQTPQLSYSDIYSFEAQAAYNGLPGFLVQQLTQLGATADDLSIIRQLAYVQNPSLVAGSAASTLNNQSVATSLQNAANALFSFALNNAAPLTLGQGVEGSGAISSATGALVTFEINAQGMNAGRSPSGKLLIQDRSSSRGVMIRSTLITRAVTLGTTAMIEGTYIDGNGASGTFRVLATDNSKKQVADSISVSLSSGYSVSGNMMQGSVRVRN